MRFSVDALQFCLAKRALLVDPLAQNAILYARAQSRRPGLHAPAMPAPPPNSQGTTLSFLPYKGIGPKGPNKGTQGDPRGRTQGGPRGPKGTQGRLRRPWGGWAHGAPWGYTEAIPNGTPFRLEGIYEGKAIPSVRKPFEWKGRSDWMALPNGKLCHVFTQPRKRRTECRRIWLDFDGFEWIWMDLIDYIETKMIPKLTI